MNYEPRDFFTEKEDTAVKGFVITDVDGDGYQVAEKWEPVSTEHSLDDGERWTTYWIPAESLHDRVAADACEQTTTVSEKQMHGIENLVSGES